MHQFRFVWIDCWILSFGCDAWNYTVVFNVNNFEKCVTWSQLCIQQRGKCSFGYNQLDLRLIETECARATEQTDVYLLQCQQDRLRIKFWWRFIFAVVQTLARCCCWFFFGLILICEGLTINILWRFGIELSVLLCARAVADQSIRVTLWTGASKTDDPNKSSVAKRFTNIF